MINTCTIKYKQRKPNKHGVRNIGEVVLVFEL